MNTWRNLIGPIERDRRKQAKDELADDRRPEDENEGDEQRVPEAIVGKQPQRSCVRPTKRGLSAAAPLSASLVRLS